MVIITAEEELRNVKLKDGEIQAIIECLECQPHNVFQFLNLYKIINKLKNIQNERKS